MNRTSLNPVQQIDPNRLKQELVKKYKNYELNKKYNYDQILFILDQQSLSGKCNRDIAYELFLQSANQQQKCSLNQIIFKYVENLQTSKLCLIREEKAEISIKQKLKNLKGSKKTYVYLKIIQITAYARHSQNPTLSYKIWPSDIPAVTVINSLNPKLDHEYTLQLQTDTFSIIFQQSGVKIAQWVWPDKPECKKQGEYHRIVVEENISFQLKINYKPINSHPKRKEFQDNLAAVQNKKQVQSTALTKLQNFQPFANFSKPRQVGHSSESFQKAKESKVWRFTQQLFSRLPFLRSHVRNLYYALICLIIIQCITSIWWPMQFLDIICGFAGIGILYDRSEVEIGMSMLVLILSFMVLIVKSIWGIVGYDSGKIYLIGLVIGAIGIKVICIVLAWICSVRSQEVGNYRETCFYEGIDQRNQGKEIEEINIF